MPSDIFAILFIFLSIHDVRPLSLDNPLSLSLGLTQGSNPRACVLHAVAHRPSVVVWGAEVTQALRAHRLPGYVGTGRWRVRLSGTQVDIAMHKEMHN